MITAENFLNENYFNIIIDIRETFVSPADISQAMIEFAKLHVEEALKQTSEKIELLDDKECWRNCSCEKPCKMVNKNSILNAYPLKNIK